MVYKEEEVAPGTPVWWWSPTYNTVTHGTMHMDRVLTDGGALASVVRTHDGLIYAMNRSLVFIDRGRM